MRECDESAGLCEKCKIVRYSAEMDEKCDTAQTALKTCPCLHDICVEVDALQSLLTVSVFTKLPHSLHLFILVLNFQLVSA